MADSYLVELILTNTSEWNRWREQNLIIGPDLKPADLSNANLSQINLSRVDLSWANLIGVNLSEANLANAILPKANMFEANLTKADMSHANLVGANLERARLVGANLTDADLTQANLKEATLCDAHMFRANFSDARLLGADLSKADTTLAFMVHADLLQAKLVSAKCTLADLSEATLTGADLSNAYLQGVDLSKATLVETNLSGADMTGCTIYGVSTWDVKLEGAIQNNLRITPPSEPDIMVDNLEVAQFLYLILHNEKLRHVIDTITTKVVLLLGRFTPERKLILDSLREVFRAKGYVPILFDFDPPSNRNSTETVTLLARMARFLIVDLTDPSSAPHELASIIPAVKAPVKPIIANGSKPYAMFRDFQDNDCVLALLTYDSREALLDRLDMEIIDPAEKKHKQSSGSA
jgi:uncharacterized protein YjbI with pentapeptide repeats